MTNTHEEKVKQKRTIITTIHDPRLPSYLRREIILPRASKLRTLKIDLDKKLKTQAVVVSVITGLGGVGKTELAYSYISKYKKFYGLRLCFDASSTKTLLSQYKELLKNNSIFLEENESLDQILRMVARLIAKYQTWVLVYDGAGKYEEIAPFLHRINAVEGGHIIITSRDREWEHIGFALHLGVFSEADAITFLKNTLNRPEEEEALKKLAKILGYLPLALSQACYLINQNEDWTISYYLELFFKNPLILLEDKTVPSKPLARIWISTLDYIQKENKEDGHPGLSLLLLQAMAYLHSDDIPVSLLKSFLEHSDRLKGMAKPLEFVMNSAIGSLLQSSMIRRRSVQNTVSVHILVQEVTRLPLISEKVDKITFSFCDKSRETKEESLMSNGFVLLEALINAIQKEFNRETNAPDYQLRVKALLPHRDRLVFHCMKAYVLLMTYHRKPEHPDVIRIMNFFKSLQPLFESSICPSGIPPHIATEFTVALRSEKRTEGDKKELQKDISVDDPVGKAQISCLFL